MNRFALNMMQKFQKRMNPKENLLIYQPARHLPVFDEETGLVQLDPEVAYQSTLDLLSSLVDEWSERRETIYNEMDRMCDELNTVQKKCDISTTAGSVVGIAGGVATIAGMILFPPAAIVGAAVGIGAAASNVGTTVINIREMTKRSRALKEHIDADQRLIEMINRAMQELGDCQRKIDDKNNIPQSNFAPADFGRNFLAGAAAGVAGVGARALIKESARIGPKLAKGLAHGAAGLGILLDTISLGSSINDLKKGSINDLSKNIAEEKINMKRETAEMKDFIEIAILKRFVNVTSKNNIVKRDHQ